MDIIIPTPQNTLLADITLIHSHLEWWYGVADFAAQVEVLVLLHQGKVVAVHSVKLAETRHFKGDRRRRVRFENTYRPIDFDVLNMLVLEDYAVLHKRHGRYVPQSTPHRPRTMSLTSS